MERGTNKSTIIDLSNATGNADLISKIKSILDSEDYTNKNLFLNIGNVSLNQSQLLSIKALIEAMNSTLDGVQSKSEMTEASAISLGISTKAPAPEVMPTFQEAFKNINRTDSSFSMNSESTEKSEQETEQPEFSSFAQLKKTNSIGDFVTDTSKIPELEEVKDEEIKEEAPQYMFNENNIEETETEENEEELLEKENDEIIKETENSLENASEEVKEIAHQEEENIYEKLSAEKEISAPKDIESALDVTFGGSLYSNSEIEEKESISDIAPQNYETTETIKNENDAKYILLDTEGITPEGIELIKANTSDLPTLYLTQTLRSGQTVSYEGNIFIIGDVHPGSEVIATGDVTVWGILGGIVHAGSEGNTDAKVRALKLNPIQLRIANLYSRRNDTINVPYVQRTNEFTPEEARIDKNQIVIYKTLRRED